MILSALSNPTRSRRTVVSTASASLLAAVLLAGCSSSGGSDVSDDASTAPAAPAVSTPAPTPVVSAPEAGGTEPAQAPPVASGTPADPTTKKAITSVYTSFFDAETKPEVVTGELQNASAFTKPLAALAKQAKAQQTTATVSEISVNGSVAMVTYTLLAGGNPILPDNPGLAVKVNGEWQVAAQTFCALVKLQGPEPAACKDPKNTALPN